MSIIVPHQKGKNFHRNNFPDLPYLAILGSKPLEKKMVRTMITSSSTTKTSKKKCKRIPMGNDNSLLQLVNALQVFLKRLKNRFQFVKGNFNRENAASKKL